VGSPTDCDRPHPLSSLAGMRDPDLHRRLDALGARVGTPGTDEREVEDLLTEGYARALAGEAQSRRIARELTRLLPDIDQPEVAKEARRLALQRRTVDQAVTDLRDKLAQLRDGMSAAPGRTSASA
jgi:hypothetical protein